MKNVLTILALFALFTSAQAQFVNGPSVQSALVAGTGYVINGITTSNIPPSLAPIFRVGRDGVFLFAQVIGTNSATTTNATLIFESVGGPAGTNVIDSPGTTFTFSLAQNGTTVYEAGTNIASSTANLLNVPGLRLRSIQNTNLASITLSNITAYVR